MNIKLYDTYLKQDVLINLDKIIKMYSCGPTVYSYLHIGNVVAVMMPELISNSILYAGGEVNWVSNVTDIGHLTDDGDKGDDKMEVGARKEGKTAAQIAQFYYEDYISQLTALNIDNPVGFNNPHATDYIYEQMCISLFLLQQKRAYVSEDGIYFANKANQDIDRTFLPKFSGSSEFSDRDIVNSDKDPEDFALWKFVDEGALQKYKFSDYPLLKDLLSNHLINDLWGCPGWHTECVAMIGAVLGYGVGYETKKFSFDTLKSSEPMIDIHTGGEDHIEVHHKNEILQSLALGLKLSKHWVHNRHLKVDNQKMSKSVGNVFNVVGDKKLTGIESIISKGINPLAFRLLFLEHDYRDQINFTWDKLEQSQNRLHSFYKLASAIIAKGITTSNSDSDLDLQFSSLLLDNLNSREVLELFQQQLTNQVTAISNDELNIQIINSLINLDNKVLKLNIFKFIDSQFLTLAQQRVEFKTAKDYQSSDKIRNELLSNGYQVDDYPWGTGLWQK
jgi:cysteinyl-tRNA synthetase